MRSRRADVIAQNVEQRRRGIDVQACARPSTVNVILLILGTPGEIVRVNSSIVEASAVTADALGTRIIRI